MPAKMAANKTEMKVKNAESVANLDKVSKVRGREQSQETIIIMTEKPTVHIPELLSVMVLRYCYLLEG